jgi:hypothetical protein
MKLLQGSSVSQTAAGQQIAEILGMIGQMSGKVQASPQEALQTLILLYLPWQPLPPRQKFELELQAGTYEETGGEDTASILVLYLQTNTLGRFRLMLEESAAMQLVLTVGHEEIARLLIPKLVSHGNCLLAEKGLPALQVHTDLLQWPGKISHPPQTALKPTFSTSFSSASPHQERPQASSPGPETSFAYATRQSSQQEISIHKGPRVSLLVLQIAYGLARFIFEQDDKGGFLQK